jgi:hypothetical protein
MPAVLTEHTQFTDSAGRPLVDGSVYFGVQNADPVISPVTIYSDRELTTPIANPQTLDSFGRTANKVWVAGRYSIRVDDVNDVQKYQELDNGESPDVGVTALENVTGANTVVATAASTITAYEDLEQYTLRAAQANTAGITLNIDSVGAKSVLKNHDQAILPGEWEADQNVIVSYNLTDDVFEWVNQNNKVIDFYEGTDVATATQPDIWVTDGNTFHFTGTTTVVDLADAPNIGARRTGIADGAFTLTHGSGITLEGSANISIAAGDRIEFYADAVDAFRAWVTKIDGTAVVAPVLDNGTAFISRTAFTTASTVALTAFDSSSFDAYKIFLYGTVSNDGASLYMRTSSTGSSTGDSGASDYTYAGETVRDNSATAVGFQSPGAAQILLNGNDVLGNATGEFFNFEVTLNRPDATTFTQLDYKGSYTSNASELFTITASGMRESAADVDAIEFLPTAGTITGTVVFVGIKKA